MSGGFCLLLELGGRPADRGRAAVMAERLAHRGPDGRDEHVAGPLAVACLHFWTVPEDRGGRQPLHHPDGLRLWLWDGRLDNRDELTAALAPADGRGLSDAALALRAYERWGEDGWERLIGPFVAAVCEPAARRVTLVRDPLGDRSLFYHFDGKRLVAASEEQAVLAGSGIEPRLDARFAARHLAVAEPDDGSTFFAGVTELLPGHRLVAGPRAVRCTRWWTAEPKARIEGPDDELAERFGELLGRAVAARLRSTTRPVLQLSGGLDSSSIAALAATQGRSMPALSWVFDELESCDERAFIRPLAERYELETVHLNSDDRPAFSGLDGWPHNPNFPEEAVFRPLVEAMYSAACDRRSRVMLTGLYGDNLFLGGGRWWLDLVRRGRWREAAAGAVVRTRRDGPVPFLWRSVLAPLIARRRGLRRRFGAPRWLTPAARRLAGGGGRWPPWLSSAERPVQHLRVLSLMNARATVTEQFHQRRHRLDLRNPFRDRRLVELVLAIPAHLLERGDESKVILRRAMAGRLPREIAERRDKTSFADLFRRAMTSRGRRDLRHRLLGVEDWWGGLVDRGWLYRALDEAAESRSTLVLNRCLFLGLWAGRRNLAPFDVIP